MVKALVLRSPGTNCDMETTWALEEAGASVDRVHINALLRGEKKLSDYGLLVLPGGFSFGDDIASGKVLANRLLHRLRDPLHEFVRSRKPVIGICNGFQVLVKCGLLPSAGDAWEGQPTVTLTDNDSGRFECRWVYLKTAAKNFWTQGLPTMFPLPVAHGEGKFVTATPTLLKELESRGQVLFRYVNQSGGLAHYPANPNGSVRAIAGITNQAGNVMGLMPHPERNAFPYQSATWTRQSSRTGSAVGLRLFKNAVAYAKRFN